MGVDPQKAWALFMSDPPDFLVMFFIVIVAVAGFVWWLRGFLVKEKIATNDQRMRLAREEQAAVSRQIEVLRSQMAVAGTELSKAADVVARLRARADASQVIAQLEKAVRTSTLASTTVGQLSDANNALGRTLSPDALRDVVWWVASKTERKD